MNNLDGYAQGGMSTVPFETIGVAVGIGIGIDRENRAFSIPMPIPTPTPNEIKSAFYYERVNTRAKLPARTDSWRWL